MPTVLSMMMNYIKLKKAIPGPGSCGGMYTANTMACAIEAMGCLNQ